MNTRFVKSGTRIRLDTLAEPKPDFIQRAGDYIYTPNAVADTQQKKLMTQLDRSVRCVVRMTKCQRVWTVAALMHQLRTVELGNVDAQFNTKALEFLRENKGWVPHWFEDTSHHENTVATPAGRNLVMSASHPQPVTAGSPEALPTVMDSVQSEAGKLTDLPKPASPLQPSASPASAGLPKPATAGSTTATLATIVSSVEGEADKQGHLLGSVSCLHPHAIPASAGLPKPVTAGSTEAPATIIDGVQGEADKQVNLEALTSSLYPSATSRAPAKSHVRSASEGNIPLSDQGKSPPLRWFESDVEILSATLHGNFITRNAIHDASVFVVKKRVVRVLAFVGISCLVTVVGVAFFGPYTIRFERVAFP